MALILGVLGVVLAVVGGVLLAIAPITNIGSFPHADVARDGGTVQLDRAGDYVGYFETPEAGSHSAFVNMAMAGPTGQPVALARYGHSGAGTTSLVYNVNGYHGEALFQFSIDRPGRYTVRLQSNDAPPGARMAFGESIAHGVVVAVLLLVPGVLLVIAALVLLIVGLVRRSGHNRELAQQAAYAAPPPGYGYGP